MIIFDLDGTLADCEHRRHFVDPLKNENYHFTNCVNGKVKLLCTGVAQSPRFCNKKTGEEWKPDWKAFYEACDKDAPIYPTISIFRNLGKSYSSLKEKINWQIWSGRCESVRTKTENWLDSYMDLWKFIPDLENCSNYKHRLKMRPIGDSTPDDQLKEKWLDEAIAEEKTIDFVFDDRPKVIRMWQRRRIFVFNCCQHDEEF